MCDKPTQAGGERSESGFSVIYHKSEGITAKDPEAQEKNVGILLEFDSIIRRSASERFHSAYLAPENMQFTSICR